MSPNTTLPNKLLTDWQSHLGGRGASPQLRANFVMVASSMDDKPEEKLH